MIPCPADSVVGPGQANLFSLRRQLGHLDPTLQQPLMRRHPVGARLRLFRGGARPSHGGAPRDEARRIAA